jgi:hypothetical protein
VARTQYPSGRSGVAAGWPYNSAITSAEFAWFALGVYKSISETGGTYSLDSALVIGGAEVTFSGYSTNFYGIVCSGGAALTGPLTAIGTTASDSLVVNATGEFDGPQTFKNDNHFNGTIGTPRTTTFSTYSILVLNGGLQVNSAAALIGSATQIGATSGDTLDVVATTTFENGVTVGSSSSYTMTVVATIDIQNNSTIGSSSGDTATVKATTTFQGPTSHTGTFATSSTFTRSTGCRYVKRLLTSTTDVTVTAGEYDEVFVDAFDPKTITLGASPAWIDGESIIVRAGGTGSKHVVGPGSLTVYLHDGEWLQLTWSATLSIFVQIGGVTPSHVS